MAKTQDQVLLTIRAHHNISDAILYRRMAGAIRLVSAALDSIMPAKKNPDDEHRARHTLVNALKVAAAFVQGKAVTDDVKAQFRICSKLGEEVLMDTRETYLAYAVTEIVHAGAHAGHYVTAACKHNQANQDFAYTQRGYILFGFEGAKVFAKKALAYSPTTSSTLAQEIEATI